jgi:hypothetical protein
MRRALIALLLLVSAAARAEVDALQMVGQARLEVLWWPVYESRLYSPGGNYFEGVRPLRLEIQYLRDVEAQDLVDHTRKEWQRLGVVGPQPQQWLETLARLWPDNRKNDALALVLDQQGRGTFLLNGKALGTIDDPGFGEDFLAIWLSPQTSRPELRLALLGKQ